VRRQGLHLVQRVLVGFVADAQVVFELPEGPHARPAVLLPDGQQQRGHGVVELRDGHRKPGAQENHVCTTHTHTHTQLQKQSLTGSGAATLLHRDVFSLRRGAAHRS